MERNKCYGWCFVTKSKSTSVKNWEKNTTNKIEMNECSNELVELYCLLRLDQN